jgi:thiamine-monophosphate kinase
MRIKKSMRTLRDVSEAELINLLQTFIASSPLMGSNEDAYLINDKLPYELINIDSMQRDGDFLPQQSWEQIGKKLVTITFSDLVTKGAYPKHFLSSLVLEETMIVNNLEALVQGIQEEANRYKANYLGGDLGTASETVLTGVGVGSIPQGDILTRKGAQVGDYVCVTGYFGLTALGFNHLLSDSDDLIPEPPSYLIEEAISKVYEPVLRLTEGTLLSSNRLASAAIDSSDGLASALNWLSQESSIKIIIDRLPIEPKLVEFLPDSNLIPNVTLFGGEEYEIVFTIPPSNLDRTKELFKQYDYHCIIIGKCEEGKGVFHKTNEKFVNIPLYGWDSLRRKLS